MKHIKLLIIGFTLLLGCAPQSSVSEASQNRPPTQQSGSPATTLYGFKRIFVIVLENASYSQAVADPNLSAFAKKSAVLTDFSAVTHPSEPNYIAMVSGNTFGITNDSIHTLDVKHIGDLLEAKGLTWKSYAEDFAGTCTRGQHAAFADKHEPFLTFKNVNSDLPRCKSHVVPASQLQTDINNNALPNYSLYVPNLNDDGHDTGVAYSGNWFKNNIVPLLSNPKFITDTLVVVTYDEDDGSSKNRIFTALYGSMVSPGTQEGTAYTHYSLLKLIEDNFGLGNLGQKDGAATSITGVWTRGSSSSSRQF